MKMPKRTTLCLFDQWLAAGLVRRERGSQRDRRKRDHHDRDAGGAAEIADQCGRDDRSKAAADRGRRLEAERGTAVTYSRTEQFGKIAGLEPKHHAMTEIHRD